MDDSNLTPNVALTRSLVSSNVSRLALLRSRKALLLAVAFGTIGVFTAWWWFGTAVVLPLLYVLPCAAMMLMCMRGHGGSGNAPVSPNGGTALASDLSHQVSE